MSASVEFFFDLSSPWTRVAFHNFKAWAEIHNIDVCWRPFLVGGVFNAVNNSVYAGRQNPNDPKLRLNFIWLKEWAKLAGVPMSFPSQYHPIKSVNAMRFCCALEAEQDKLLRFADAAFNAYFADQRNLDDPAELVSIASNCGMDGEALEKAAAAQSCKDRLRLNTQEAIDRGAFGSPTFFIDRKFMYFGNDQLPLVYERIASANTAASVCDSKDNAPKGTE